MATCTWSVAATRVLVAADFPLEDDMPAASTTLDSLADAVVGAGITSITGAVVGDASRYDDEFVNAHLGARGGLRRCGTDRRSGRQ